MRHDMAADAPSVVDLADAVRERRVTPAELVEDCLTRIDKLEDQIHAWSHLERDRLRREADLLTREAEAGLFRGPLHGVPIGIKDEFHVLGMPTAMRARTPSSPEPADAAPVAFLRAAGAAVVGKTYVPVEGSIPPTRNPWNLERTAGATSSGSGAAVGAAMVPAALAEQTGGSALRPAAYCGVAGFKPTYGRVSRYGCLPFAWSLDHPAVIARTVADLSLVLSVIAVPDDRDAAMLRDPVPPAAIRPRELRPPRIGVLANFFPERLEPSMASGLAQALGSLEANGARVAEAELPGEFGAAWAAHRIIDFAEGATYYAGRIAEGRVRRPGDVGTLLPASYYLQARRFRTYLGHLISPLFDLNDVLVTATAPGPAPLASEMGDLGLLIPWSLLGYPTATVPCGLSPDGLPLGMQLVGPPRRDHDVLCVAAWVEDVLGRLPLPPCC